MRYEKKVLVLGGSLIVLLGIWAGGLLFSPDRLTARAEAGSLLAGPVDSAATITLVGGGGLTLQKQGGSWYLVDGPQHFPVQASRVSSFLEALASVKRLRPLAQSREAWAGFSLDDAQAKSITVKAASGSTLTDLRVGGYGPTGAEVYVRRSGSDTSYAADASFAAYLSYGRSGWLDLQILPQMPVTDIQGISVQSGLRLDGPAKPPLALEYRLTRSSQGWSGLAGLDPNAVDGLARSLLSLEAEDYVAAPPANCFEPVSARIELSLGAGGSKVIEIGRAVATPAPIPAPSAAGAAPAASAPTAAPERFYGRLAGSPYVFEISSYSLRASLKSPADLIVRK